MDSGKSKNESSAKITKLKESKKHSETPCFSAVSFTDTGLSTGLEKKERVDNIIKNSKLTREEAENASIADFKEFALNHGFDKTVSYSFCLAKNLEVDEKMLGKVLLSAVGNFYCTDTEIAEQFGFFNQTNLFSDKTRIANELGISFQEVAEAFLSNCLAFDESCGCFNLERFIFIDLPSVYGKLHKK